ADVRSDLFAVGVSMFETLTGRRPFSGVVPYQIFKRIVSGQVPDPNDYRAGCSPGLVLVIFKLLAREPSERYPSGAALVAALEDWLTSEEGQATAERERQPFSAPLTGYVDPNAPTEL